jgi:hypothetical protein
MSIKCTTYKGKYSHGVVINPHKALASAIIMAAIHDRRESRAEVLSFFQGEWFETVAELAMLDPDVVREKLKIPKAPVKWDGGR